MFSSHRPTPDEVNAYLARLANAPFSYKDVGCTSRTDAVRGFHRDHERVLLGQGEETFRRACEAIGNWQMLPREVVEVSPVRAPIEKGTLVAILYRARPVFGWLVLPTRILEVTHEPRRFGFAYGTVEGHWERGEERFLIERDESDSVWYDLLAISRPRHPLAWLGYPYTRATQARFRRHSCRAMQSCCEFAGSQTTR